MYFRYILIFIKIKYLQVTFYQLNDVAGILE